jgi:hypothetical protein
MLTRIGNFFILIGVILLLIFFFSDYSRSPVYNLVCIGLPLVVLGVFLKRKGHQPLPPSDRFRIIHQYRQKSAEKKVKEKE